MTVKDDYMYDPPVSATTAVGNPVTDSTITTFTSENGTPVAETSLHEQPHAETPLAESLSPNVDVEVDDEEARRVQHWKESEFAVGLVDVTWADSRRNNRAGSEREVNLTASAYICPLLGAGRVGNMAVLRQSTVYQEVRRENGTIERVERPKLDCVVGPYWIMPAMITFPIILVLSFLTLRKVMYQHVAIIVVWSVLTVLLITSLLLVACRNPGIMYRYNEIQQEDWRWNDQARTFRPKSAKYDPECAAVIEGFDHT